MSCSYFPPILLGLSVDILVFISTYFINLYFKVTPGPDFNFTLRVFGLLVILLISLSIIYYVISRVTPIRTWTFYVAFLPLFIVSSLDVCIFIDVWKKPNNWIFTEYTNIKDNVLESVWASLVYFFDGTILHLLNFVVLWRAWNGKSWRSLLIFNAVCMGMLMIVYVAILGMTRTKLAESHPALLAYIPAVPFYLLVIPIMAFELPRNFTLKPSQTSVLAKNFDLFTAVGLLASTLLLTAQLLTVQGSSSWVTDVIWNNYPMLLYEDTLKNVIRIPVGAIQLFIYLFLIVPSLTLNVYYKLQSEKPDFLWELTVVQFASIVSLQFYYVVGPLFWETRVESRVILSNMKFWLIGGLPVAASALNLISLLPYRVKTDITPQSQSHNTTKSSKKGSKKRKQR